MFQKFCARFNKTELYQETILTLNNNFCFVNNLVKDVYKRKISLFSVLQFRTLSKIIVNQFRRDCYFSYHFLSEKWQSKS